MKGSIRCLACRKPNKRCNCRGETSRELRVFTGRDPINGRAVQRSKTIRATKREANTALAAYVTDLASGEITASTATLAEAMNYWVDHVAAQERGEGTLKNYRQITKVVASAPIGQTPLQRLDTFQIQAFYDALKAQGRAANTIGRYHAAIRAALNLAISRRWTSHNPALGTARPSIRNPELTIPSPAQVVALIGAAGRHSQDRATFLRLAAASWARRGELVALRRSAVFLGPNPQILIATSMSVHQGMKDTKSHGKRQITIDTATAVALRDHFDAMDKRAADAGVRIDPDPFVFSDEADCARSWHPDTPTRFFGQTKRDAGIFDVRLHDLRHFGATQALAAGVPITTVAYRLGHSKVTTTLNVYAHFLPATDDLASGLMGRLLGASPPALASGADPVGGGEGDDETGAADRWDEPVEGVLENC